MISMPRRFAALVFALAVAAVAPPAGAQDAPAPAPPGETAGATDGKEAKDASAPAAASEAPKGFESLDAAVAARVAAVAARDLKALKATIDPACFEGLSEDELAYVDDVLRAELAVPMKDVETKVEEIEAKGRLPLEGAVRYPVRPNRTIQASFVRPDGTKVTYLWTAVVEEDGRCRMTIPVPGQAATRGRIESRKAQAERDKRIRALADAIKEPLRSELMTLLKTSNLLSATRRYAEASGADEGTAALVVDRFMRANGLADYQDPAKRPRPTPTPKPAAPPAGEAPPAAEPKP